MWNSQIYAVPVVKRYKSDEQESLKDRSRKPKTLVKQKINDELELLIKSIRIEYKFGPQRIHTHLLRLHSIDISAATIWRVLKKNKFPISKSTVNKTTTFAITGLFLEAEFSLMSQLQRWGFIHMERA